MIKGCLHPSWGKKIPVFYDSHRLSASSLYIVRKNSAIFLWSRLFEWDVTVPLRMQKQLNPAFDPLPSLVNRKFCRGGGWGVGRGVTAHVSTLLPPPTSIISPSLHGAHPGLPFRVGETLPRCVSVEETLGSFDEHRECQAKRIFKYLRVDV